ncbi:MAG: aminotransferase class I/II-fold pyridoxal phosphate-dependent enzyme [Acidimicrobiia bacterium]|nr:aminotransferase class I/II-fold pyridoxal phosphate-dependent enzyme [Acidimicrobiia bacterium]
MPGFEVIGAEEQAEIDDVFRRGGVLFRHGFDGIRNGCYKVRDFESAFAQYMGVPHALAVTSGTAALRVALAALDLQPGDEVITQAFTFVATAEAIIESRLVPVCCEVDDTLNMDPADLERRITSRTRAVIAVHMLPRWEDTRSGSGFNYRMTEMQAALGLSQLQKLDEFVAIRQEIASYYDRALSIVDIHTPWQHPDTASSFHLYPIQVTATSGISQQSLYKSLSEAGVKVNLHYIPVYLQPYYARLGFYPGYCPHAEDYFKSSISIPVYASMTQSQQHRVVDLIQSLCHAKVVKRIAGVAL